MIKKFGICIFIINARPFLSSFSIFQSKHHVWMMLNSFSQRHLNIIVMQRELASCILFHTNMLKIACLNLLQKKFNVLHNLYFYIQTCFKQCGGMPFYMLLLLTVFNLHLWKLHFLKNCFLEVFQLFFTCEYLDSINFQYLISMAVHFTLKMRVMYVVIIYLYGSLKTNLHMKVPPRLKHTNLSVLIVGEHQGVKLQCALYGLKQSGRIRY